MKDRLARNRHVVFDVGKAITLCDKNLPFVDNSHGRSGYFLALDLRAHDVADLFDDGFGGDRILKRPSNSRTADPHCDDGSKQYSSDGDSLNLAWLPLREV